MTEQAMQRILDLLGSGTMTQPEQGPMLALAYIQGRLIECSEKAAIDCRRRLKGESLAPHLRKAILLAALTAIADELDETIRGLGV